MKIADRYHRFVGWSEEDQFYIGYCPDLYFGGVCHGEKEEEVYSEFCGRIRQEIEHRQMRGDAPPERAVRVTGDVERVAV
jgi:hypothetical protein